MFTTYVLAGKTLAYVQPFSIWEKVISKLDPTTQEYKILFESEFNSSWEYTPYFAIGNISKEGTHWRDTGDVIKIEELKALGINK
jgi:hypothetical protein